MLESNDRPNREAREFLSTRFGVTEDALGEVFFFDTGEEIWVASEPGRKGVVAQRPSGLRALRRAPDGLKPTSSLLCLLDQQITQSRIEVTWEELRTLLLGHRLDISHLTIGPADDPEISGYVAVSYQGDVVGCGRVRQPSLQLLIPTGRRRELLSIVEGLPDENR